MRSSLTFFLLMQVTLPALAQTRPAVPPLVEQMEVRLVNVDVTVTDSSGRPVSGLTPADFDVFEDDAVQPIIGFYAVQNAAARLIRGDESLPVQDQQPFRRKFVVMIDNNTVQKPHRDAAIEYIAKYIEAESAPNTEWAVVTVGADVETLQAFTTDKEAIRIALLKARRKPTLVAHAAIDRDLLSDPGRGQLRERHLDNKYDFGESATFQSREQTKRNLLSMTNSARAVVQTARAYSAAAGKKALIFVTGGMELNTTFGAFDKRDQDRNLLDSKKAQEQVLDTMAREANAANFKIYVIKAGGHHNQVPQHDVENRGAGLAGSAKNPFFGEGYTSVTDSSNVDSAPLALAMQTGGRYLPASDVGQSLDRIDDETANFYSLAFRPRTAEDGKYHRLSVRLKRPGMHVLHRAGYVALSPDQRLELALRSPITFEKEKGTLPVTLDLEPAEKGQNDKRVISVAATMPLKSLTTISRGDYYTGRVHIYLSIYDQTGNNVGYHHQIRDVKLPADQLDKTLSLPFQHNMKVALKKGSFTVVVTMRDELSNEIGSAYKEVRL